MTICSTIVTISGAFLINLLVAFVAIRAARSYRARRYFLQQQRYHDVFAAKQTSFNITEQTDTKPGQGLLALLAQQHRLSIAAQDAYQSHVVGFATGLAIAFTAVALSTTVVHHWASKAQLAWLDLVALLFVLYHFIRGQEKTANWLRTRCCTELLRQYAFLSILIPSSIVRKHPRGDLAAAFHSELDQILSDVISGHSSETRDRLLAFWRAKRAEIEHQVLVEGDLTPDTINHYLNRRPLRQLAWFHASKDRLEKSETDRLRLLTCLYVAAIAMAASKVYVYLVSVDGTWIAEYISAVLLMTTGIASVVTAIYLGNNTRSLIHRYKAQENRIDTWMNQIKGEEITNIMTRFLFMSSNNKQDAIHSILLFEDLMIEELADWLEISRHDSIELSP